MSTDFVLAAVKKIAPMSIIFLVLGVGISYIAYASDLAVSNWPWEIGVIIAFVCLFCLFIACLKAHRTNALWAYGVIVAVGIFSLYYFFGIFAYFCYFLFAPMLTAVRVVGLAGGVALTVWWLRLSHKSVSHTIEKTTFVARAFTDDGKRITYAPQVGMRIFEKLHKEKLPFPRVYVYVVYGLAPFCLVLSRILSENFGSGGVLLFMAALGMPVSLWLAGLLVRIWLIMVLLPRAIEKEQGKRVVVIA
jgi:hypothetical protein